MFFNIFCCFFLLSPPYLIIQLGKYKIPIDQFIPMNDRYIDKMYKKKESCDLCVKNC